MDTRLNEATFSASLPRAIDQNWTFLFANGAEKADDTFFGRAIPENGRIIFYEIMAANTIDPFVRRDRCAGMRD